MVFIRVYLATLISVITAQTCQHKENLALQGTVAQSGTIRSAKFAKDGDARPALQEGNHAQCFVTKPNPSYFPWLQIDLQDSTFNVSKVEIYAPDDDFAVGVGNTKTNNYEDVHFFSADSTICWHGIRDENTGRLRLPCNAAGRYVTIIKQYNSDTLTLCEVEIYGENHTNLALGKDTKQSSDVYDAVSSLAVDGRLSSTFYSYKTDQMFPVCTHTSEEVDRYPWWRVDLGDFFIVKSLIIYNRGEGLHSRLHDIEIRVGLVDIDEYSAVNKQPNEVIGDVRFTENLLCASVYNDTLYGGKNEIDCSQPTLGRYVSIQIIRLCDSKDCQFSKADVKNMLTLCEVEVFGERLNFDVTDGEYLSLGKSISTSFDNSPEYEEDDEYSWLSIDLQDSNIVYTIEIFPEIENTDFKMPEVEIRVGNEPINSSYNNEHFTQNQLCVSWLPMFETTKLFCENAVMGRYVTFQLKQCHADNCLDKQMTQDAIQEIKVWGLTQNAFKYSWNVAPHKPTTSSSIINSGFSSLAVDKIIPDMNCDDNKCALTAAKHYPWWRVDLKAPHRVLFVAIHLPANINLTLDSDLEVRFGDEDIANHTDDSLFNKNHVCAPFETDSLETRFQCDSIDSGRYISVQLNDNSPTAQSLQLCEVEVIGCEL